MSENQVQKPMKTKCYYTDYVNHAIRFYLTTPDTLKTQGKRKADIENWVAVQTVFYRLSDSEKQVLKEVYTASHRLPEGVRMYCKARYETKEEQEKQEKKLWVFITKIVAAIARKRGLV